MSDPIDVTYEIGDGYVGGSRPQHLTIDPEDFKDMTYEQIQDELDNQVHEDMLQTISTSYDMADIISQIQEANTRSK
ncbi:MAG: hypothetical protein V3U54_07845 [Thermodesulfobacteriota bacterium]